MNEFKQIHIMRDNGDVSECVLSISQLPPWQVVFNGLKYKEKIFSGEDLFVAMIAMRLELEKDGYAVLCNGARKDIVPSRMSRQMSGGRKAYVIKMGHAACMDQMLDIFDYTDSKLITTVEQQKRYQADWFASLK